MKERYQNFQIGAKNTEETTVNAGNRKLEAGTVMCTLTKIQKAKLLRCWHSHNSIVWSNLGRSEEES